MNAPYYYVRFRWWQKADIKKIEKELGNDHLHEMKTSNAINEPDISSLYKDELEELKVSADTLTAMLSAFRAIIFQKEAAPFTLKDENLKKMIFSLYPHSRPTPFPWSFEKEPEYEMEK